MSEAERARMLALLAGIEDELDGLLEQLDGLLVACDQAEHGAMLRALDGAGPQTVH